MGGGRASASVFSGRPDPEWSVDDEVVRRLDAIWRTLDAHDGSRPARPPLGYRGCMLTADDIEYAAFGGIVTRGRGSGRVARSDPFRRFERVVLESAPTGSFPDVVLKSLNEPA